MKAIFEQCYFDTDETNKLIDTDETNKLIDTDETNKLIDTDETNKLIDTEDETSVHFFLRCPLYTAQRSTLLCKISAIISSDVIRAS